MTDKELKELIVQTAADLYRDNFLTVRGGNISVRSIEHPEAAWITPSQVYKGAMRPEQLVLVDLDGNIISGNFKPSMETLYHTGIMRVRPEVNAVFHTHPPFCSVFSTLHLQLTPVTVEAVAVTLFARVPFFMPGSMQLADAVVNAFQGNQQKGAFLQNHGLITAGQTILDALELTMSAEHVLKIFFQILACGEKPELIDSDSVDKIIHFGGV